MKGSIFHKMQTSTCWIVCLVLLGVYLFAALRPGVWLRDAFLYRQADGSFSGKDAYAAYTLQLSGTESEAEAVFTLDGETRHYRIEAKDSAEVKIYQDGALIFAGSALGDPGDAILWREDDGDLADEVKVIVNGEYQKDDLWPSCGWLYNVAVGGRRETRGSVAFLLPMGALARCFSPSPRRWASFWAWRWRCCCFWISASRCCSGISATGWRYPAASRPTGTTRCSGWAASPTSLAFLCWRP